VSGGHVVKIGSVGFYLQSGFQNIQKTFFVGGHEIFPLGFAVFENAIKFLLNKFRAYYLPE
jgi:hypothetical protein